MPQGLFRVDGSLAGYVFVILLFGKHGDDSCTSLSADGSVEIVNVLPVHEAGVPSIVSVIVYNGLVERSCVYQTIMRILTNSRLAQNHLACRDAPGNNLIHRCTWEDASRDVEKALRVFIHTLALVVELDIVEVNHRAHFLIHSQICAHGIFTNSKVRSLRGMGDDGSRLQIPSEDSGKSDEPIFATAITLKERISILPINIHSVVVVVVNEVGYLQGALNGIDSCTSRHLGSSKSAHQQFHSSIREILLESGLYICSAVSVGIDALHVIVDVRPDARGRKGIVGECPEGMRNVVVDISSGEARHSECSGYQVCAVVTRDAVDVDERNRHTSASLALFHRPHDTGETGRGDQHHQAREHDYSERFHTYNKMNGPYCTKNTKQPQQANKIKKLRLKFRKEEKEASGAMGKQLEAYLQQPLLTSCMICKQHNAYDQDVSR